MLTDAGFVAVGRFEFPVDHCWTVGELAGHVYSTSFLPAPLFGARTAEFERDLAARLTPHGPLVERVSFA